MTVSISPFSLLRSLIYPDIFKTLEKVNLAALTKANDLYQYDYLKYVVQRLGPNLGPNLRALNLHEWTYLGHN